MPITIDDVGAHPEWGICPHRLQVAAAVQGGVCTPAQAGLDPSQIEKFNSRLGVTPREMLLPK